MNKLNSQKSKNKVRNRRQPKRMFDSDTDYDVKSDGKEAKFCGGRVNTKNDPSWYFKEKQILNDVASFSFNQPIGARLNFNHYRPVDQYTSNLASTSSVPGVMGMYIGLTAGVAENAQSPLNLGATNVYSYVRYKNSGASNYDSPDLMLYLIAMDSLYACWNWMKRIYGYASSYSQRNWYMPKAYAAIDNVDFDDIISNLADFRGWLNIKSQEIAAFCVPATFTYMVRHSWLFSNFYTDSNTAKAQQYMYTPAWFYKYDETSSPQGGLLTPVEVNRNSGSTKWTFASLQSLLNGMLEAVNYSEDIGIMSGDILKAYGESGLFTLSIIPDDYKVMPVFSEEVLTQIENAQPFRLLPSDDINQFAIRQDPDTNYLVSVPFLVNRIVPRVGGYLNFHWEAPTPEQVIVATRLKQTSEYVSDKKGTQFTSLGSEFCINVSIAQFVAGGDLTAEYSTTANMDLVVFDILFTTGPNIQDNTNLEENLAQYLAQINAMCSFDWAPEMLIGYSTYVTPGTPADGECFHVTGTTRDWDNYVQLDDQDIQSMNTLALISEFNVPN